jgi:predicted benzoate:H+ symporter BenE
MGRRGLNRMVVGITTTYAIIVPITTDVMGSTFQQYSSYIVAVSFIVGVNQRTSTKPQIYRKSLTNFIT